MLMLQRHHRHHHYYHQYHHHHLIIGTIKAFIVCYNVPMKRITVDKKNVNIAPFLVISFLSEHSMCVVHGQSRSFGPLWSPKFLAPPVHYLYIPYCIPLSFSCYACPAVCRRRPDLPALPHLWRFSDCWCNEPDHRGPIGFWMSSKRLRLNPHNAQFIWLDTRQQLAKLDNGYGSPYVCFSSFHLLFSGQQPWCHSRQGAYPWLPHLLALSYLLLPAPSASYRCSFSY